MTAWKRVAERRPCSIRATTFMANDRIRSGRRGPRSRTSQPGLRTGTAQYRDLMPQHQQLNVLGDWRLATGERPSRTSPPPSRTRMRYRRRRDTVWPMNFAVVDDMIVVFEADEFDAGWMTIDSYP